MRRPATTPSLFVNGFLLTSKVRWGGLKLTDRWPYGCWEAEWDVVVKPYQRIPALVAGAIVEARIGSGVRWVGTLDMPDWDSGKMRASGLGRMGEQALCLNNSTGETTSIPDTAIDHAIARGVPWIRRSSVSSTPFASADATTDLNYLTALLDAFCTSGSLKWAINARRELVIAADTSKLSAGPAFSVRPGVGELGVSSANQAAKIFGRYRDANAMWQTLSVGAGLPEVGVSLAKHGTMNSTKATAIITGIRDAVQPRPSFSNGVTVTADMVTTVGGQRLGLEQVIAGGVARMLGLRDDRGTAPAVLGYPVPEATDVVVAESVWDVTAGQVTFTPASVDDQTLAGAVEAAGGVLL